MLLSLYRDNISELLECEVFFLFRSPCLQLLNSELYGLVYYK